MPDDPRAPVRIRLRGRDYRANPAESSVLRRLAGSPAELAELEHRATLRLLLDNIAEVRLDGSYVSGELFARRAGLAEPGRALRRPGVDRVDDEESAIRHAARLPSHARFRSLYRAGSGIRTVATAALTGPDPWSFLRLDQLNLERRGWMCASPSKTVAPWRVYRRARPPAGRAGRVMWKLYVSPALEALPEAVATVAEVLEAVGREDVAFKFTYDPLDMTRLDKLVVYSVRRSTSLQVSARLSEALADVSTSHVPFAGRTPQRKLTWAVDPPAHHKSVDGLESWRTWLLGKVDRSIQAWADGDRSVDPHEFVTLRLAFDDIEDWAPNDQLLADFDADLS